MSDQTPITILDIGTTKVICMQVRPDQSTPGFEVLGYAYLPCTGLSRGSVVDIDTTVHAVRSAVKEVESQTNSRIRDVMIGLSGLHVSSTASNGIVGIRNKEVTTVDVERVIEAAKAIAIPDNQTLIHTLPQEFIVDGQAGVKKPIGMNGVRLEACVLMLRAVTSALQNVVKCVEMCGLRVKQVIAQPVAVTQSVLSADEKDLGVCLLDIGGGTTDVGVCKRGALRHVSSVPIAGEHVTNDLAVALCTPPKSAEAIKVAHGKIISTEYEGAQHITVDSLSNQSTQKVSTQLLSEVIEARYHEILSFVKRDLKEKQLLDMIPGGIVITGGGALVPGLVDLTKRVFNCQARIAEPTIVLQDRTLVDASYAASLGLILQALQERDRLDGSKAGAVTRMWTAFQHWLDYHL